MTQRTWSRPHRLLCRRTSAKRCMPCPVTKAPPQTSHRSAWTVTRLQRRPRRPAASIGKWRPVQRIPGRSHCSGRYHDDTHRRSRTRWRNGRWGQPPGRPRREPSHWRPAGSTDKLTHCLCTIQPLPRPVTRALSHEQRVLQPLTRDRSKCLFSTREQSSLEILLSSFATGGLGGRPSQAPSITSTCRIFSNGPIHGPKTGKT